MPLSILGKTKAEVDNHNVGAADFAALKSMLTMGLEAKLCKKALVLNNGGVKGKCRLSF